MVREEVDVSGYDDDTGLGDIIITFAPGVADHYFVGGFFDLEIYEDADDDNYYNETGSTSGTPAAGQSWEIDEPGFGSDQVGTEGFP